MNASQSWLYSTYRDAGPAFPLVVSALSMNAVALPGFLMNAFLCYTTLHCKHKIEQANHQPFRSLRSNTNWLIFMTSLCECFHETGHMVYMAVALSGTNFVAYPTSIAFQYQAIFGVTASQAAMSATAIDRLLAIAFPLSYKRMVEPHSRLYLGSYTLLCCTCGLFMVMEGAIYAAAHTTTMVTGYISDLLIDEMGIVFQFVLVSCVVNIVCYLLIGVTLLKYRYQGKSIDSAKIIVSLVVILVIVVGGYFFNNTVKLVVNVYVVLPPMAFFYVQVLGGLLLNIGAGAGAPILYIFSMDYRVALANQLLKLFGSTKGTHSPHPPPPHPPLAATTGGASAAVALTTPLRTWNRMSNRQLFAPPVGGSPSAPILLLGVGMVPQIQIAGRYAARPSRRRVFPLLAVPPIAAGITSTSAGGNQTMNN